jgi:hypothetical protein
LDDAGSGTARYIKQSAGYNPSPMGRAINKTLMTFGAIVLGAGFGLAQQGPPPEKFQQTDIFVTSYKGTSVADPSAYQNSKAGQGIRSRASVGRR